MTNYHPSNVIQIQICGTSTIKVFIYVPVVSTDNKNIFTFSCSYLNASPTNVHSVSWWYTFELSVIGIQIQSK